MTTPVLAGAWLRCRMVLWANSPSAYFSGSRSPGAVCERAVCLGSSCHYSRMSQGYRLDSDRLPRRGATPICGISHCHNQPAMAGPLYHHSSPTNVLIHRYSVSPQSAVFPAVIHLSVATTFSPGQSYRVVPHIGFEPITARAQAEEPSSGVFPARLYQNRAG